MKSPYKRSNRRQERRTQNSAKVLTLGLGLILVPLFLQGSPLGTALQHLPALGIVITIGGGVLLWLDRRDAGERVDRASSKAVSVRHIKSTHQVADDTEKPTRPTVWGINVLEVIEWRRLEAVVETLFQQGGFETKSQSHGADGGVDIWLFSKNKPGQPASLVQCKHWSNKVGVDKVREFKGVMASHRVERGQFVGSGGFTEDAMSFARANGINLLDQDKLLDLIARRQPDQQQHLLSVALDGEYWKPTCASCGVKMVKRTPRNGGRAFWGCVKFPTCRNSMGPA